MSFLVRPIQLFSVCNGNFHWRHATLCAPRGLLGGVNGYYVHTAVVHPVSHTVNERNTCAFFYLYLYVVYLPEQL